MSPRMNGRSSLPVATTFHLLALCAAMAARAGTDPAGAPDSGDVPTPWNPFALEVVAHLETSHPGGDVALAFTGGGTIVAIDQVQFRLAGFDKESEKRGGLHVAIDQASFEIADSTYSWDVRVILDEATGGVVAFYTAYGGLPSGPVREPQAEELSAYLASSGVHVPTDSTSNSVFSEVIIQAWGCGVPVSKAAGITGRFMERRGMRRPITAMPGSSKGQRSIAGSPHPVVEQLWIISGVDCPDSTVETPGRKHVHVVFVDSDRRRCASFDTY